MDDRARYRGRAVIRPRPSEPAPERVRSGALVPSRLKLPSPDDDHANMTVIRTAPALRRRAPRRLIGLTAVFALALVPAAVGPGSASASPPAAVPQAVDPSPGGTDTSGREEDAVAPPTEKDIQTQRDFLDLLRTDVGKHSDALVKAQADQAAAAEAAGVTLEAYALAERAQQAAQTEENLQRDRLLALQLDLGRQKAALGRWARAAYQEGQLGAEYGALLTVLSAEPTDDLGNLVASLNRIGRSRSRTLERYVQARDEQAATTEAAGRATEKAVAAAAVAEEAKTKRDSALAEQQRTVIAYQEQLGSVQGRQAAEQKQLDVMERAAGQAARYLIGREAGGPTGECAGGDTSIYPNGQIPVEALCAVWGVSGHHLRADAAYAFNQLSQAFATTFGSPICVTDSYRTYDEQVDLYGRKPNLAARPGTSNHGWGTATDLCGGIQSFSTAQHQWMVVNAPAFSWFHPSWARQGGSRPEPWHFEYGG